MFSKENMGFIDKLRLATKCASLKGETAGFMVLKHTKFGKKRLSHKLRQ
jgi:hypothetical protein